MIMQEETTQKTMALALRASRLTEDVLRRAMAMYLQSLSHPKQKPEKHGRMTVKQLLKKDDGATVVEAGDDQIRNFRKAARKYRIDYAVRRDKSVSPPKYIIFFKAKDLKLIEHGFAEFCRLDEKKKPRSVRKLLSRQKGQQRENNERERKREKERETSR